MAVTTDGSVTHNITLTVLDADGSDDVKYGLMVRNFYERDISSFAPKIASGDLKYGDGTIYQTVAQTDFSHGFGFRTMTDPQGYAFSGDMIDSRFSGLLMLTTNPTDASTKDTNVTFNYVTKFCEHLGDVYAGTSSGVYKWDNTNSQWISTGQDTGAVLDMMSDYDKMYVTLNGARARYFNDGGWGDAGVDASFSDMEFLTLYGGFHWATDDDVALLHYASEPEESEGWEGGLPDDEAENSDTMGAIHVGTEYIPITNMLPFQNVLYIGKENGLYYVPSTDDVAYQALSYDEEKHPYNFNAMSVWQGALYFSLKNTLWRMTGTTITDVTSPIYGYDFPFKRNGHFRFLTPVGPYLYVIADEDAGISTSKFGQDGDFFGWGSFGSGSPRDCLFAYDGVAWHKLVELGSASVSATAMCYTPTDDRLWYALSDGTIKYIKLETHTHMPHAYYETTTTPPSDSDNPHYLYTSQFDSGLATVYKHFSKLSIKGIGISDSTPVDVYYAIDGGGWTHLGTFDETPIDTIDFPVKTSGRSICFRLNLQTSSANTTPVVEALILQYLPRPTTIYSYSMDILVADEIQDRYSRRQNVTGYTLYEHLKNSRNSVIPVTFVDMYGNSHTCYQTEFNWVPQRFEIQQMGYPGGEPRELEGYIRATFAVSVSET